MRLFNKDEEQLPIQAQAENLVYDAAKFERMEQKDIEKIFARLFSGDDGMKALSYLQTITFHRALGSQSSDFELRHLEGQRSMVATILRLIDRGRKG